MRIMLRAGHMRVIGRPSYGPRTRHNTANSTNQIILYHLEYYRKFPTNLIYYITIYIQWNLHATTPTVCNHRDKNLHCRLPSTITYHVNDRRVIISSLWGEFPQKLNSGWPCVAQLRLLLSEDPRRRNDNWRLRPIGPAKEDDPLKLGPLIEADCY